MLTEEIIRAEMRLREWEAERLGREREAMTPLKREPIAEDGGCLLLEGLQAALAGLVRAGGVALRTATKKA